MRKHGLSRGDYQIPRDQRELLARPDAWDRGKCNLPRGALEQMISCHQRRLALEKEPSQTEPAVDQNGMRRKSREVTPVEVLDTGDPYSDNSEQTPLCSWSSSPVRENASTSPSKEQIQPEQLEDSQNQSAREQLSHEDSLLPRLYSPTRAAIPAVKSGSRELNSTALPSGAISSVADLEIAFPGAITEVSKPIQKKPRIQPEPIPPSAQHQVIPSTFSERTSPAEPVHVKKWRLMKLPNFSGNEGPRQEDFTPKRTLPGLTSTKETQISTSNSPATLSTASDDRSPPGPSLPSNLGTASVSVQAMEESKAMDNPEYHADKGTQEHSGSSERIPPNGPSSQVPWTAWKLKYPQCKASLKDYLRAILVIQQLQGKNALPEFLYDDFIRVWSEEFLGYVRDYSQKQEKEGSSMLNALEYYNKYVKRPRYIEGLVTADTLEAILARYPDQIRQIRQDLLEETDLESPANDPAGEITAPHDEPTTPPASSARNDPSPTMLSRSFGELPSDPIETVDSPDQDHLRSKTARVSNRTKDFRPSTSDWSRRRTIDLNGRKFKTNAHIDAASSLAMAESQVSPDPRMVSTMRSERASPEISQLAPRRLDSRVLGTPNSRNESPSGPQASSTLGTTILKEKTPPTHNRSLPTNDPEPSRFSRPGQLEKPDVMQGRRFAEPESSQIHVEKQEPLRPTSDHGVEPVRNGLPKYELESAGWDSSRSSARDSLQEPREIRISGSKLARNGRAEERSGAGQYRIQSTPLDVTPTSPLQAMPRKLETGRASFEGRVQSTPLEPEAMSISQLENAETIPETTVKRKNPPSSISLATTAGQITPNPPKKTRLGHGSAEKLARFREFVRKDQAARSQDKVSSSLSHQTLARGSGSP